MDEAKKDLDRCKSRLDKILESRETPAPRRKEDQEANKEVVECVGSESEEESETVEDVNSKLEESEGYDGTEEMENSKIGEITDAIANDDYDPCEC